MFLIWLVLASFGHLVALIGTHNWFYGLDLPKRLRVLVQFLHIVAVLALPTLTLAVFPWNFDPFSAPAPLSLLERALLCYLIAASLIACVWLPFLTLRRHFRRDPAILTKSEVIDLAKELGHRPIGDGHDAWLAHLPANQLFHVEFAEKTLHLPRLPQALRGLTILHLSDLHFHGTPDREWFDAIISRCNEWNPDLVAITGDIVDSDAHHRWILPILGRLRYKHAAFAILGNHDYRHDIRRVRRRLRRLKMHVLENNWLTLEINQEKLHIVGHEGPWLFPPADLADCPEEGFRLCLSHTPDNIRWLRENRIDLALAGHVHGGQIRIPPFGSVFIPSLYGRRYDAGTFDEAPTLMHVVRGLNGEHPVRYNCYPEVALLTLERG
jgi:hypothetical protein